VAQPSRRRHAVDEEGPDRAVALRIYYDVFGVLKPDAECALAAFVGKGESLYERDSRRDARVAAAPLLRRLYGVGCLPAYSISLKLLSDSAYSERRPIGSCSTLPVGFLAPVRIRWDGHPL